MNVFEYLIFKNEKKDKDGRVTEKAVILVERTAVLAKDIDQAKLMASRAIPEEHMEDLDRLVIACRPF